MKEERVLYPSIDQVTSEDEREADIRNGNSVPEERYKVCCGQH